MSRVKPVICAKCASCYATLPSTNDGAVRCPYCGVDKGAAVPPSADADEFLAANKVTRFAWGLRHKECPTFWLVKCGRDFHPTWCPFCKEEMEPEDTFPVCGADVYEDVMAFRLTTTPPSASTGGLLQTEWIEVCQGGAWSNQFAVSPSLSVAINAHLLEFDPDAAAKLQASDSRVVGVLTTRPPGGRLHYAKFVRRDVESWTSHQSEHIYICQPVLERLGIDDDDGETVELFFRLKVVSESAAAKWHALVQEGDRA